MIEVKKLRNLFTLKERDYQKLRSKGFGEVIDKVFTLNVFEVLFLLEKNRINIKEENKSITFNQILKKVNFEEYLVFKDLRNKGYIIKTGLKYGFPFRIYEKGTKIGEEHSLFFVEVLKENSKIKAIELAAKARIANSTKKYVIYGIVDSDNSITYIQSNWKRL